VLVLSGSNKGPRSVLFLKDRDAAHEKWEGERLGLKRAKRKFRIDEVRPIEALNADLPALLRSAKTLHYAPGVNSLTDQLIWRLIQSPVGPRVNFPNILKDSRLMLSEMRFVKDRSEIAMLRHASDITAHSLRKVVPLLAKFKSEKHCARVLEENFAQLGAGGLAFETIVAAGKHATVLHHRPQLTPLWKRELVLIDTGAQFRGYAADISRTLPVSGKFSTAQAELYDVVLHAREEAQRKAIIGGSLDSIHDVAVRELAKGLVNLGIVNGPVNEVINKGLYRRFYPHRTGNYLGLDVHDIAPITETGSSTAIPLVAGNALTIEPGLYFDAKDDQVPREYRGIGIRIEDSVLVTAGEPEILTAAMPTARSEIEALMNNG